jgi:hypothetical protein
MARMRHRPAHPFLTIPSCILPASSAAVTGEGEPVNGSFAAEIRIRFGLCRPHASKKRSGPSDVAHAGTRPVFINWLGHQASQASRTANPMTQPRFEAKHKSGWNLVHARAFVQFDTPESAVLTQHRTTSCWQVSRPRQGRSALHARFWPAPRPAEGEDSDAAQIPRRSARVDSHPASVMMVLNRAGDKPRPAGVQTVRAAPPVGRGWVTRSAHHGGSESGAGYRLSGSIGRGG